MNKHQNLTFTKYIIPKNHRSTEIRYQISRLSYFMIHKDRLLTVQMAHWPFWSGIVTATLILATDVGDGMCWRQL